MPPDERTIPSWCLLRLISPDKYDVNHRPMKYNDMKGCLFISRRSRNANSYNKGLWFVEAEAQKNELWQVKKVSGSEKNSANIVLFAKIFNEITSLVRITSTFNIQTCISNEFRLFYTIYKARLQSSPPDLYVYTYPIYL